MYTYFGSWFLNNNDANDDDCNNHIWQEYMNV